MTFITMKLIVIDQDEYKHEAIRHFSENTDRQGEEIRVGV